MKTLLIAASAITLLADPAQAQLIGGSGGLGGGLGGTIGGTLGGGTIGSGLPDVGPTVDRVRSSTRGMVDGTASTSGDQTLDRRSGRVDANRSVDANGSASIGQVVGSSIAPVSGSASGSSSASGQSSASAQLIGTDAVRGIAGEGVSQARGAAAAGQSLAGSAAGQAQGAANGATGSLAGSASGSGSAAGNATSNIAGSTLAAAGSSAASGNGAFAVQPGMDVLSPGGEKIGEVRQVVADSRGQVREVIVAQGNREAPVPAANLQGSGSALYAVQASAQSD